MRIFTLTMNPAIDVSTEVERLAPSQKLRCSAERRDPGGGGINVARVVRRLGGDVVAVFAAGGATGDLLGQLIEREGIPGLRIGIAGDTREDFTVFERATRQQYRFVMPGPMLHADEEDKCLAWIASLNSQSKFLVLSGSLPPGAAPDVYARAIRIAKQRSAKIVLDTSGAPFAAALREGVHLVKPNLRELRELMGSALADQDSCVAACRKLIASGQTEVVALSLGSKGAILATRNGAWRAHVEGLEAASVVGAGDSFLGGLLTQFAAHPDPSEALRVGVAAGSAAVINAGTELCHADDVHAMLARVALEQI